MIYETEFQDHRKAKNDRLEEEKAITPLEIKNDMKILEQFLMSEQYRNVEELQHFFSNVDPKTLEKGLFLVDKLPKLIGESEKIHKEVSLLFKHTKTAKQDFEKELDSRNTMFKTEQETRTEDMKNLFNKYNLLFFTSIVINLGLVGFVLYKLLPFIDVNFI